MKKLVALLKEEEGQGMTEYGLIIGLIVVIVVAALVIFRTKITALFEQSGDAAGAATLPAQ